MAKTITVPLSEDGMNMLLKEIERYQKSVNEKIEVFLGVIADELMRQLAIAYAGAHGLNSDPIMYRKEKLDNGGYRVVAESPEIGFIEFGAGVYAGLTDGSPYSSRVDFDVYPGSWSKEHAGTWQKYKGDPYKYPYNVHATNGMYHAVEATKAEIPRLAKEVFGDG